MKKTAIILCLAISMAASAQSPYLSVMAAMDGEESKNKQYKIELKFCQPVKMTGKGSWFTRDTSAINFGALKTEGVTCGGYSGNGDGTEVLSGNKKFAKYNFYEYSNQVFAWELMLVFRITDSTAGATKPPMYIVLPIKYKSFVTHVTLDSISFYPGKVIFIDQATASYQGNALYITSTSKSSTGIPIKESPVKEWIE